MLSQLRWLLYKNAQGEQCGSVGSPTNLPVDPVEMATPTLPRPSMTSSEAGPSVDPSVMMDKDTDILVATKEQDVGEPDQPLLTFEDGSPDDPQVWHTSGALLPGSMD